MFFRTLAILLATLTSACAPALQQPPLTSVPTYTQSDASQQRLITIFNKVKAVMGDTTMVLNLSQNEELAATVCSIKTVYMKTNWMQQFTDNEIVLIMGHEFSHCSPEVSSLSDPHAIEMAADIGGVNIMKKLGYSIADIRTAAAVFLKGPMNPDLDSTSHPSGKARYAHLISYINTNLK
jgi:hypothetical protein